MGFPSEVQILGAARRLSEGSDGFIRTSGLWHVLMFLRYRVCHHLTGPHTFQRGADLAEAAFDLNGLSLPVEKKARNVYFEPGASQGNNWSQFFRHYDGPRQTYLYRIYTGLTGKGQNQPKLFNATFGGTDNALPATVDLAGDWLRILRDNQSNAFVLDSRIQELVTWIFRFGIPDRNGQTAHIAELSVNGSLQRASGVEMLPIPETTAAVGEALGRYLGLAKDHIQILLPQLARVRPSEWNQSDGVTVAALSGPLQSGLGLGTEPEPQQAVKQSRKSGLVDADPLDLIAESFNANADDAGLVVNPELSVRFLASLLSKRFLILTGLSGSGKTKLAQAFARWITADPGWIDPEDHSKGKHPNHAYTLVPVGADWTTSDYILGYPDGLAPPQKTSDGKLIPGKYITKPALDLILAARRHPETPYFLVLDEMNLSHIERYFSDVLSMIESGEGVTLYCDEKDGQGNPADTRGFDPVVKLPGNLFVVGTVNVDETTYMFSPKVLDRGNVLEFRVTPGAIEDFLKNSSHLDLDALDGKGAGFAAGFVAMSEEGAAPLNDEEKNRFDAGIILFHILLTEHGSEFGYRVINEALRFMQAYKMLSPWLGDLSGNADDEPEQDWFDHGFDAIVIQKFLPKIHGSKAKVGPLLKKLHTACVRGASKLPSEAKVYAETLNKSKASADLTEPSRDVQQARYPLSADKIFRMWRQLNENGFTAFSEN